MNTQIALVIDTNSRYSDAWEPCFGRLNKHFPRDIKKYIFTDPVDNKFDIDYQQVNYDDTESYRNQFLGCIKQVQEEYILYTSEDYILYKDVDKSYLKYLINVLHENKKYSFIKLIKGPEAITVKLAEDLFEIDSNDKNLFAQQASIWRTKDFEMVFETSDPQNGRMQHEPGGSDICRKLGFKGLQCYNGEPKRGLAHHDSNTYPYIATAIVKGKWNVSEYTKQLQDVFEEYNIDPSERGVR